LNDQTGRLAVLAAASDIIGQTNHSEISLLSGLEQLALEGYFNILHRCPAIGRV
jgi:hypothetical protein